MSRKLIAEWWELRFEQKNKPPIRVSSGWPEFGLIPSGAFHDKQTAMDTIKQYYSQNHPYKIVHIKRYKIK